MDMDDLTAQFAKMQAHIVNLEKKLNANERPQNYGMGNQTETRRTNFSERAQFDKSKVQCFKCNEFGHYQNECINESRRIPPTVLRRNVNTIGQDEPSWTDEDYFDDHYWEVEDLEAMENRTIEEEYSEDEEPQYY